MYVHSLITFPPFSTRGENFVKAMIIGVTLATAVEMENAALITMNCGVS